MRSCDVDDCDRKHRAKGLCAYHYRIENPSPKATAVTCPTCAAVTFKRDKSRSFCSLICRDVWRIETGNNPAPQQTVCKLPSSHPVRLLMRAASQSPLRTAFERQDWATLLGLMEAKAVKVDDCWLWPVVDKTGYGRVTIAGRTYGAHRLAATAERLEAIPSHMPVHHTCAEPTCINPQHLQIITPHENVAEMLERRHYQERIALLEAALLLADPDHPLIATRIPYVA